MNKVLQNIQQKNQQLLPQSQKEYTVVLDLDNTLIHVSQEDSTKFLMHKRPFLNEFLISISEIAEIIIFTAAQEDYANQVVQKIDPENKFISHVLSRKHLKCFQIGQACFMSKDLSIIGRDLDKTLMIDDLAQNFMMQPHNGIPIPAWEFNMANAQQDYELLKVARFIQFFIEQKLTVVQIIQMQQQQCQQQLLIQQQQQQQIFQNNQNQNNIQLQQQQMINQQQQQEC